MPTRAEQTPPATSPQCTTLTSASALDFFEPLDFRSSSLPHDSLENNINEWEERWYRPWERLWRRSYGVVRVGVGGGGVDGGNKTLPIYLQLINIVQSTSKIV
jgi:hypothetical protein